ncbi:MAG: C2 family cysteine protease, partial [Gemmataceae bacterium]
VDFNDGTYGVRLGSSFYRVDDDLPVESIYNSNLAYAKLGVSNSMWVAIMEKAYAHYRNGSNSYATLNLGGLMTEVYPVLGSTATGNSWIRGYSSATAMANDIFNRWNNYQCVTMGFFTVPWGIPLSTPHAYSVASVTRNSWGVVTSITLHNPWGIDGQFPGAPSDANPYDGLVTLTPDQLFRCDGVVQFANGLQPWL